MGRQQNLFDRLESQSSEPRRAAQTAPYVSTSDTSREAAERIQPRLSALQQTILAAIKLQEKYGKPGLSCAQLESVLALKHQTCSARCWELKDLCRKCWGRITYDRAKYQCDCTDPQPCITDTGYRHKGSVIWGTHG